jgi:glycine cleavage system H protein
MNTPDNLHYAKSHEWLRIEKDSGTVGITDHAQSALSDVVFVELPKSGRVVKQGEVIATVESVKAASDIYAPVGGTILESNETLSSDPTDRVGSFGLNPIHLSLRAYYPLQITLPP